MKPTAKHRGTIVPMATPFTHEGALDERAVERIINHIAGSGLGVFVLGTMGEATSIPPAMRRRLVEIAHDAVAGRVLLYAGIGNTCLSDSVQMAQDYLRLGVDAVVSVLPSYYPLIPAEMEAYFTRVAHAVAGPLVIYNIPATTHMSVPVQVMDRLSALPNVIGFKDTEKTPGRLEEISAKLTGRPDLSVFMGVSALSCEALKRGYDGLIPSSGNLVPGLWRELWDRAEAGDWDEAAALQRRLDVVAAVFQRDVSLSQAIATLKAAMSVTGLCTPAVLPPLLPVDETTTAAVAHALETLGLETSSGGAPT